MSYERSFYLQIDTFAHPAEHPNEIAALLEDFRLVVDIAVRSGGNHLRSSFSIGPLAGSTSKRYAYNQRNWDELMSRAARGELGEFRFALEDPAGHASVHPGESALMAELVLREHSSLVPDWAYVYKIDCTVDLLGGAIEERQEAWVAHAGVAARALRASTGYLTHDSHVTGLQSSYEDRLGLQEGQAMVDRYARGYYWLTILGATQIERLGGADAVKETAPCHAVHPIGTDPAILMLQLTPRIDRISEDELRGLRTFLSPVLRKGRPEKHFTGPEYRLVPEDRS
jgi:Protein of unknown function (DUF3396)